MFPLGGRVNFEAMKRGANLVAGAIDSYLTYSSLAQTCRGQYDCEMNGNCAPLTFFDDLGLACRHAFMLDANSAALSWSVRSHDSKTRYYRFAQE